MIHNIILLDTKVPALFFGAIFLIGGILWSSSGYSFITPISITILAILAIFILKKKKSQALYLISLIIIPFLIGYFIHQQQIHTHNAFYKKMSNKKIDIIATVKEIKKQ